MSDRLGGSDARQAIAASPLLLETVTSRDGAAWNEYVDGRPDSGVCARFQWKEIFEKSYGKSCRFLTAKMSGRIVGVLPLVYMRGPLGGDRLVSLPFLDQGGILADDDLAAEALFAFAVQLLVELGGKRLDLRGGVSVGSPGPEGDSRYTFILDLGSIEEVWKSIGPKVRNQIRKSEKSGLSTRRVEKSRLPDFFAILSRNMHRLGSPTHSLEFFASVLEGFGDQSDLYLTFDGASRPVGGAVAISHQRSVAVPWASSLFTARSACPNHSLYWRILQDSVESGAEAFDFGRSAKGGGTYHFKKQWNARPVKLKWQAFDQLRTPMTPSLLSSGNQPMLAKIWRLLPGPLAVRLGPLVRRNLSN